MGIGHGLSVHMAWTLYCIYGPSNSNVLDIIHAACACVLLHSLSGLREGIIELLGHLLFC